MPSSLAVLQDLDCQHVKLQPSMDDLENKSYKIDGQLVLERRTVEMPNALERGPSPMKQQSMVVTMSSIVACTVPAYVQPNLHCVLILRLSYIEWHSSTSGS